MNDLLCRVRRVPISLVVTAALLCGLPVALVWQCLDFSTHVNMLAASMLAGRDWLELVHLAGLGAGAVGVLVVLAYCRRLAARLCTLRSWRPLLWWLCGSCTAVGLASWAYAALTFGDVAMTNLVFDSLLLITWGAWAVGLVLGAAWLERHPGMTAGERALFAVVALVLTVEAACTVVDGRRFTMAFVYNTEDQREFAMYREALRGEMFGYPFNSQGYYDKEFRPKPPGGCVVSWIADSFGLGVVPYPWNVTTVVEDRLREAWKDTCNSTEVLNFSVPQMGMKGYVQVAEHEAPPYQPDVTVLCVYTCNDITVSESTINNHGYLQNWRLTQFFRRQLLPYSRPEPFFRLPFVRDPNLPRTIDEMLGDPLPAPEHVLDPSKEVPTFSQEVYHARLVQRLRYLEPEKPSMRTQYRLFFQALEHFRAVVNTPMLLVVAPDELQVDDAVWESLMVGRDPSRYVRDLPQQRILEYCRATGLPVVDLLPVLREAQQTLGRVYHRQDTHWNALGNRVAGEAVARAIAEQYAPRGWQ